MRKADIQSRRIISGGGFDEALMHKGAYGYRTDTAGLLLVIPSYLDCRCIPGPKGVFNKPEPERGYGYGCDARPADTADRPHHAFKHG